jgi:hypothetical protein
VRRASAALLSCLGWAALLAFALPFVLPPYAGYRTAVALVAILLFGAALAAPRPGGSMS